MNDCFDCRFFETPQQHDGYAGYLCHLCKQTLSDNQALEGCEDWQSNVQQSCTCCGGTLKQVDHFLFGQVWMCYNQDCEKYLEVQDE